MSNNKKLIEIYEQSSNFFYNNKKNFNEKSKHWTSWYDSQDFNFENLKNFRNSKSKLSAGLDSMGNNLTFKFYSEIIDKVSENYLLNNLPKKNIGNSDYLIPYKNFLIDTKYNRIWVQFSPNTVLDVFLNYIRYNQYS